ncbi:MAG: MATE family efflux transporter [Planctomycetes bacterium]|nr:MATE family efflux transporter [Planctomycetota bacterium]
MPEALPAPPLSFSDSTTSLRRQLLRLTWPVVLQNISRTFMLLVDTAMIGRVGTSAMASMAIIAPIVHSIFSLLVVLGVATLATVARATGEGDRVRQERAAATSLLAALGSGGVLMLLGLVLAPLVVEAYRDASTAPVLAAAHDYTRLIVLALPLILLEEASAATLRGAGDTRTPMIVALAANALNVFGNYVFIFGAFGTPALGVVGAGLSTAICHSLQGLVLTGLLFTRRSPIRLSGRSFAGVTRDAWARLGRIAGPAVLEPLVIQSGFLVYLKSISMLGPAALAAHRTAITIESLSFMPGYGFSVACSVAVGQLLGERRPDVAVRAIRESVVLAALLMSVLGVAFLAIPEVLMGVFIRQDADVIGAGAACLRIASLEQPLLGAAMALAGALRGAGDTRSPVAVGALGVWGIRVPLAYALAFPAGLGLTGVWITMIVDWGARAAAFAWIVRRGSWKR